MLNAISIDDEPHNNDYLKHCCSLIPFIKLLATFTDPFAALPLLSSGKIDLLFLDFHLGGITAAEFMKKVPPAVKVIIVSSEMENSVRAHGMEFVAFVPKPYPCERLLAACNIAAKMRPKKGF